MEEDNSKSGVKKERLEVRIMNEEKR